MRIGLPWVALFLVGGCGGNASGVFEIADAVADGTAADTASGGDGARPDGNADAAGDGTPGDATPGDAPADVPVDVPPTCELPKKLCGGVCLDVSADPANCGDCGKTCAAPMVCGGGTCAPPKCKSAAPSVLFYGPCGSMEKPYLPAGATSTIADDATWRGMKTADFAKYDLIVIGAPDLSVSGSSTPSATILLAAYETRAAWGPAVNGRALVLGLDPAFHAVKGTAGATVFQKASLIWLTTGAPGTTALYVNSDWGNRTLDFLSPIGAFSSSKATSDTITVVAGSHPVMTGSTSSSLSSWSTSSHSFITFPTGFTSLATAVAGGGGTTTTGSVAAANEGPACTP